MTDRPPRRRALWQWLGLSAALLLVTTVVYITGGPQASGPVGPATVERSAAAVEQGEAALSEELGAAVQHFERAIAVLQDAAAGQGDALIEPKAAQALAAEGAELDRVIAESKVAAAENPESEPARVSLFEALRRKVEMLQATVRLINEMNQGDPAGAARAAEGLERES